MGLGIFTDNLNIKKNTKSRYVNVPVPWILWGILGGSFLPNETHEAHGDCKFVVVSNATQDEPWTFKLSWLFSQNKNGQQTLVLRKGNCVFPSFLDIGCCVEFSSRKGGRKSRRISVDFLLLVRGVKLVFYRKWKIHDRCIPHKMGP